MKNINRHDYQLTSGRRLTASYSGVIGLQPTELAVHVGYDGDVDGLSPVPDGVEASTTPWTPAERAELADFMIAAWQRFKGATEPTAEERVREAQQHRDRVVTGTEPPG